MGEYLSVGELKAARRGEQNHDDSERDMERMKPSILKLAAYIR